MLKGDALAEHFALMASLGVEEAGLARKRRLYLAALCRRYWEEMPLPSGKTAVERAEAFADGHASAAALATAHKAHLHAHVAYAGARGKWVVRTRAGFLSGCALEAANPSGCRLVYPLDREVARIGTHLLRDLFGSAADEVQEAAPWRTQEVADLARAIYDAKAFDRLPHLAEALADAGCTEAAILAHCRAPGPHVRGCWALDLILHQA